MKTVLLLKLPLYIISSFLFGFAFIHMAKLFFFVFYVLTALGSTLKIKLHLHSLCPLCSHIDLSQQFELKTLEINAGTNINIHINVGHPSSSSHLLCKCGFLIKDKCLWLLFWSSDLFIVHSFFNTEGLYFFPFKLQSIALTVICDCSLLLES